MIKGISSRGKSLLIPWRKKWAVEIQGAPSRLQT